MVMEGKEELTPREREVLELVLQRWHNKEIADHLVLSVRTVETRVAHLLAKFENHNGDELTGLKKIRGSY